MMLLRRLFLAVALLLAGPALAVPAMWQVGSGDRVITIYGTVHALPPKVPGAVDWFTPAASAAFAAADALVVEVVFPEDPQTMAAAVMRLGLLPAPSPILDRVPADVRPRLAALIRQSGLPPVAFDRMKSWFAAITLVQMAMAQSGLDPGAGVDVTLLTRARAAGRRLVGLETPDGQLGLFDALPEAEQRLLLASAVADAGDAAGQLQALVAAWNAGDVERILKEFDDASLSPAMYEALFRRRNAAWADWVQAALQRPGRHFMAVGAAHMAGPDSLIAMLAARGIKAERVE
ncbi:MAG: TraB/GumN family protein [Alphaproteobacteria bacterium]|nr:TraB/GumN family protein [Alphaproteobacteria bacterium]